MPIHTVRSSSQSSRGLSSPRSMRYSVGCWTVSVFFLLLLPVLSSSCWLGLCGWQLSQTEWGPVHLCTMYTQWESIALSRMWHVLPGTQWQWLELHMVNVIWHGRKCKEHKRHLSTGCCCKRTFGGVYDASCIWMNPEFVCCPFKLTKSIREFLPKFYFACIFLVCTWLILWRKLGSPYLYKATATTRAAPPSPSYQCMWRPGVYYFMNMFQLFWAGLFFNAIHTTCFFPSLSRKQWFSSHGMMGQPRTSM